ncbi:unnamed protein product [Rangifer tarandus platyrhynchus]|uniref:Uncharacterized protein n=2 Tax=Rangifer tarandus platyrhynchus TaxID=3082113 RepID=A0ABN8YXU5_RANTA|nr:unnamed protein product [Rangifer tarandus platyrhynchus]CAI9694241.1 unnamed protein product [Rangifer tarandus platyrhynchus]
MGAVASGSSPAAAQASQELQDGEQSLNSWFHFLSTQENKTKAPTLQQQWSLVRGQGEHRAGYRPVTTKLPMARASDWGQNAGLGEGLAAPPARLTGTWRQDTQLCF